MGRRRKKGVALSGWAVVDTPAGMTSTQVVGKLRWAFNAQKAGHAGTLDPLATGILPIAFGEATKTIPYIMDAEKVYRFTAKWGEARDTDDAEGEVTQTSDVRPSRDEILAALPAFAGVISQVPPKYSAIKVDGERAYDLARDGEEVELSPREVEIYEIELIEVPDEDHATFEIECSKGTYVRSLVRDLARKLGTFGHVSALRRLAVGPFDESCAQGLDKWVELSHIPPASRHLLPIETALDDIPALAVTGKDAGRLRQGQAVLARPGLIQVLGETEFSLGASADETVFCSCKGDPVAICHLRRGELQPVKVFNLNPEREPDVDYARPQSGGD